jgi:hypothetical protein
MLFDNGNDRAQKETRVVEYKMDWDKKTATYLWSYPAPTDFPFRRCCGLAQRLKNGNTFVAWGGWQAAPHDKESIPVATEINRNGDVVFEIRSTVSSLPYRVWKNEH